MAYQQSQLACLDPAQARLVKDDSRVISVCWHRQKGKDFTTSAKAVLHAMQTGQPWYIVSLTQRQADETFKKCKCWAERFKARLQERQHEAREEYDADLDQYFEFRSRELRLPNGGSVVSLPGKDPDTLAGLTGNVIFTEFGLFPNGGYDHWRVVFPLATRGYHVIAISTPRSKQTKFYELVSDRDTYSVHFCDIHQSVAEGFQLTDEHDQPISLEAFKAMYGDEAGWQREYECQFTGDLDALVRWSLLVYAGQLGAELPFDLVTIENDSGFEPGLFDAQAPDKGRFELGWDVARKGDISALWINHAAPGRPKHLRFLVLMQNCKFDLQRQVVREAMQTRLGGVGCGDATGLGMESNEVLRDTFGERWEPVDFGGKRKSELGSTLATTFGDGDQAIPPTDGPHKFIAADLYAIQKEDQGPTNDRRLKLYEQPNPLRPESHCDIAYAGALSLRAGSLEGATPKLTLL